MTFDLGPDNWRGEHLIVIPRAPKPEPAATPKGFVSKHIKDRVYDMARKGEFVPKIAQHTGLTAGKVRDLLIKEKIDFKRAKPATTGRKR